MMKLKHAPVQTALFSFIELSFQVQNLAFLVADPVHPTKLIPFNLLVNNFLKFSCGEPWSRVHFYMLIIKSPDF